MEDNLKYLMPRDVAEDKLIRLNREVHKAYISTFYDNYRRFTYVAHEYKRNLLRTECEQVISFIKAFDFVLYPNMDRVYKWDGDCGPSYSVISCFRVMGLSPEYKPLLRFKPSQVQNEQHKFKDLVQSDTNKKLMDFYEIWYSEEDSKLLHKHFEPFESDLWVEL